MSIADIDITLEIPEPVVTLEVPEVDAQLETANEIDETATAVTSLDMELD